MAIKKDHPWIGSVNLIINNKGEILLMKRAGPCQAYAGYWGLVGGFMECGETPTEAAAREAKEEIGVKAKVLHFIGRYYNTPHPMKKIVISLPHYSKIISGTPKANQPEECSEVRWFKPEEVRKMTLAYDHKQILQDERLI